MLNEEMKSKKVIAGFSLIELMITVAVVGVLASIAYPSFREQIMKSRRSDAMNALSRAASMQERWFTEHSSYTTDINNLGGSSSEEGYYTITVSDVTINDASSCTSGTYIPCFRLAAQAAGSQAGDSDCDFFFLDSTGNKSAVNSGGSDSTNMCWVD